MIADFLSLYVNHGVFLLDEQHRHRVAKECRHWNDISSHDERRFLKHMTTPELSVGANSQSHAKKVSKSRSSRRRVVQDTEGNTVCWNFNARKGCELPSCRYSHVCANCMAKHPQYEWKVPQKK